MSVILDALQKARGDRQKNQVEPHPNSVARVLEPSVPGAPEDSQRASRSWVLPVVVVMGGLFLIALAGGAFFLLYQQMQRLEPTPAPSAATIVPPTITDPGAIATPSLQAELAVSPGALPPPLPLSDLPVQPPAAAPGAEAAPVSSDVPASAAGTAVSPAPSAAPPFKLGSIVCEGGICMALINGRTVRQGERIRDFIVTEITDKGVTLKNSNTSDEIHLDLYN